MSYNPGHNSHNLESANQLFKRYGAFIRTVIRTHLKDEAMVDDVFQDFFLAVIKSPVPEDVSNIESYLYRRVTNNLIDAVRRAKSYKDCMRKYAQVNVTKYQSGEQESIQVRREDLDKVFELIEKRLRPKYATVLKLRFKENYDNVQVAQKMGISVRAVDKYIAMSLKRVHRIIRDEEC